MSLRYLFSLAVGGGLQASQVEVPHELGGDLPLGELGRDKLVNAREAGLVSLEDLGGVRESAMENLTEVQILEL